MRVLAGDVGGTKTLLAIVECNEGTCTVRRQRRYASADYPGLDKIATAFLRETDAPAPDTACFAVAGPIKKNSGQTAMLTNLPWQIDSTVLARELGVGRVALINDFEGVGYGIDALTTSDLVTLQPGQPERHGVRAVLGAGTGLGQSLLFWSGDYYTAVATEGGHVDFAPTDDLQTALHRQLTAEFGHVSCERLLSGAGLVRLYRFLVRREDNTALPNLDTDDKPAAAQISELALTGADPVAGKALNTFVRIYGAHAGNLALSVMATGGIYIAGGIAPKVLPEMTSGAFIEAFNDKGRMAGVTRDIPVRLITYPGTGLLGAALFASRLS